MFYCNECAEKNGYPVSWFKSHGSCELCGKTHECNDIPCKDLPRSGKSASKEEDWNNARDKYGGDREDV